VPPHARVRSIELTPPPTSPAEIGTSDPTAVNAYGANLTATLKAALLQKPGNGAFVDACEHHGGGWRGLYAGGVQSWEAWQHWYTGGKQQQQLWLNSSSFPCKACCGRCSCCVCK
jgi:hypothetical protein